MQREDDQGRKPADFETAKSELSERFQQETQTATEALHDARNELTRKAGDYASETKQQLFNKAEGTQRDISSNLKAFSGALRAASEHLANNDQRTASKLTLDAAGGLERLSSSLKDKPFEDVLGEMRSFGRENSGALIAGSVLAGLALGRFIKSSPPTAPTETQTRSQSGGGSETVSNSDENGTRSAEASDATPPRFNQPRDDRAGDDLAGDDWAGASLEQNP
jgi:F0F1-type ATP synthase membrane subunit b/b'